MLTHIYIRDLATIESLELDLSTGNTMITGETGAGKSIFIEAIELALGGRASTNLIRSGKDKAEISLSFDITSFPKVIRYLQETDLMQDNPECIIRRVITSDGRSRCYVNGSPSTLPMLKELGDLLFHLHGQHEQHVLLKSDTQRDMLDRFADHLPLVAQVKQLALARKTLQQQIDTLRDKTLERHDRLAYLNFQLDELQAVNLQPGEWETLEAEHHKLTHREELVQHLQHSIAQLAEGEPYNILHLLHELRKTLDAAQTVEPKAENWLHALNSATLLLNDLTSEISHYLQGTELDPETLQAVEERVSLIYNLSRKHKCTPQTLVTLQAQLLAEQHALTNHDAAIAQLEMQLPDMTQNYLSHARQLSLSREKAAHKLEKEITATIRSLSLPHGEFKIALELDQTAHASHGMEKINFLIKTNPDQALQPLAKVISGGELSRLSLAAHLALANRTTIPTLVFDEVDTGLSGATAEKIGKILRKLGESYQVFCVTHQPQVAACGHHQLLVEKYFDGNSTYTRLRPLKNTERTAEIARMLGGLKITKKTLEHAREVLESV
ncbi:MAG: DNA repair protein RecN [Gammaproteobacteria bacterium RIFCSPHIGHO2_12_FULL_45_12]|nr:MAG: DNA repair protein RecN [Gammaproteobacteria bacterium RIFCSPHIGHO2_12_FULL_45_12]